MKKLLIFILLITYGCQSYAAQVETLKVKSVVMDKYINNIVILPESYKTQQKKYPVVYLLHGAGGNHRDWLNGVPKIKEYANNFQIIIVCPNGGKTSWYFDSLVDLHSQYETYIAKELVQAMDATYNTIQNANARAITGLSMGGHGAFYLAFKHPKIWGAAGSMSGGLDLCPFSNNWEIYKRLGNYNTNKNRWEEHSVINMIDEYELKQLHLIFDCGTDDFFYEVNKRFATKLKQCDIPHQFIERDGAHNWEFWIESVKLHLSFFDDFFVSLEFEIERPIIQEQE